MYLGYFAINDDNKNDIFMDNMAAFKNKDGEILSKEKLDNFAVCLNSPWSQTHEKWVVECNCKDSYTEMEEDHLFRCFYQAIGFEYITSRIYGYENTAKEALEACLNNIDKIQDLFNQDNESF